MPTTSHGGHKKDVSVDDFVRRTDFDYKLMLVSMPRVVAAIKKPARSLNGRLNRFQSQDVISEMNKVLGGSKYQRFIRYVLDFTEVNGGRLFTQFASRLGLSFDEAQGLKQMLSQGNYTVVLNKNLFNSMSAKNQSASTSVATTSASTSVATTSASTSVATTSASTSVATTSPSTSVATTSASTSVATTSASTSVATTSASTSVATTSASTSAATTSASTSVATTSASTSVATTSASTSAATTSASTSVATTSASTSAATVQSTPAYTRVNASTQTCRADEVPANWVSSDDDVGHRLVELAPDSDEFRDVSSLVRKTKNKDHEILKIQRVENHRLYRQYLLQKESVTRTCPTNHVVELDLFHDTHSRNLDSICYGGFDRSTAGLSVGARWGAGSYFSTTFRYSAHKQYASDGHIIICKALVGESVQGRRGMTLLPFKAARKGIRYDSAVDDLAKPSMYVIFADASAYPAYVVTITVDDRDSL